jgi:hypothetical protein
MPVDEAHSGLLHLKVSGDFQRIYTPGLQPAGPAWQPVANVADVLEKSLITHKLAL